MQCERCEVVFDFFFHHHIMPANVLLAALTRRMQINSHKRYNDYIIRAAGKLTTTTQKNGEKTAKRNKNVEQSFTLYQEHLTTTSFQNYLQ